MQKIISKKWLFFLECLGFFLHSVHLVYSVLTKAEEATHASLDIFKKILCF